MFWLIQKHQAQVKNIYEKKYLYTTQLLIKIEISSLTLFLLLLLAKLC